MTSKWHGRILRSTLFSDVSDKDFDKLWRVAARGDFEHEDNRPAQGLRRRFAKFEDAIGLNFVRQPGRIDVSLAPVGEGMPAQVEFGEVAPVMDMFVKRFQEVLSAVESKISRIAFAGSVSIPCRDREEAYGAIASLLAAVKVDVKNSRELVYQINRPVHSSVVLSLELNRLTKWSTIRVQPLAINMGASPGVTSLEPERHYCDLEFDINTPAEGVEELPAKQLPALAAELANLALRNMQFGEMG